MTVKLSKYFELYFLLADKSENATTKTPGKQLTEVRENAAMDKKHDEITLQTRDVIIVATTNEFRHLLKDGGLVNGWSVEEYDLVFKDDGSGRFGFHVT